MHSGQPKLTIIFRGSGLGISQEERQSWHPGIYANEEVKEMTSEACRENQETLIVLDNLHGQTTECFKKPLEIYAAIHRLLPSGCTGELRLIDAGVGQALKVETMHRLDECLMEGDNLERW